MTSRNPEPYSPEPSRHQRTAWGALLRVLGVVRRAPLVVLLAMAVMVVTVGAAAAEPAADAGLVARARRLQAKLDGQHAAVERLTERLNAAQERREQLQRSLDGLRARQQTVAAELQAAQQKLNEQARAIYMQGPEWLLSELLGGAGASGVPGQQPLQRAALQAQAGVVTEVRVRKAELDGINERLATDLGEADLVYDRSSTDRQQLQALVDQLQTTLKQIDGRLAGWLEAEEARAEAARRAAWAGYMAGVGSVESWVRAGPAARAAVRWALGQLGDPYRWGAEGPAAFDCSGLTSSAYLAAGISIPRTSLLQWGAGPHPDVAALLPGDLLFYGDDPHNPATIHHVGLYIGNGLMVHAPQTGDVVRIASVWRAGYVGAMRVVPGVPKPGAPPTLPLGPPTTVAPPVPPPMTIAPTTTRPTSTRPPTTTAPPAATVPPGTTSPTTTTEATTTAPPTTTPAPTTTEAPTTTAPPTTAEAPTTTDPPPTS
jgi:peptidoglycan DL-endopeptidase CwlO